MIEIIPAMDLMDGRCVRLSQGDFSRATIYGDDPLEMALEFEAAGIRRLHMVDLDGARLGAITNLEVLETIASRTGLTIDFGGGIKTSDDIKAVFDAGAAIATLGSIAVKEPSQFSAFLEHYDAEKILLGADVRGDRLSIDGWQTRTDVTVIPFLKEQFENGVRQVFVTDIAKDGVMQGPSIDLYGRIIDAIPGLKLIASGGVRSMEDIQALENLGCSGVIVGKAIYGGAISVDQLARQNQNAS